jgi:rhamnosyltransferase
MTGPVVSCIIPTRNAGAYAAQMIAALEGQTVKPAELLVMDSGSTDGTPDAFAAAGAVVERIDPMDFHHAGTRNRAASRARGKILMFLTQDAIPADSSTVERLIEPITAGTAEASFARHLPRPEASPLERFARNTNYPPESRTVGRSDVERLGVRAYFFSNSCSAINQEVFALLGGFPEHTVMNEDMLFAAEAVRHGYRLAYTAMAKVWHSHDLSAMETLRRYFDVGTVFTEAAQNLPGARTGREGATYLAALLSHLANERRFDAVPAALLESLAKFTGYSLGRHHRRLPHALRRQLSLHASYWGSNEP